jgi:hypothetical protein
MNEKLLGARPTDGAAPAAGFFLAFAAALRIERQAERQRFLADRTFGALEQAGDLSGRNDIFGGGSQRFHFHSEPRTPLFLGSQWSLLISLKKGLLAQALTEGTTISRKAFQASNQMPDRSSLYGDASKESWLHARTNQTKV